MTVAYVCILVAALLPIACAGIAKAGAPRVARLRKALKASPARRTSHFISRSSTFLASRTGVPGAVAAYSRRNRSLRASNFPRVSSLTGRTLTRTNPKYLQHRPDP